MCLFFKFWSSQHHIHMLFWVIKAGRDGRLQHWRLGETVGYTLKAGGDRDGRLHTEGWRRRSAAHWRLEETVSYRLKAGGDGQLHTTHWRLEKTVRYTLKAGGDGQLHTTHWRLEETVSYTLNAGGDSQLHREGWRRCSAGQVKSTNSEYESPYLTLCHFTFT